MTRLALPLLALLLAACSGGSDDADMSDAIDAAPSSPMAPQNTAAAEAGAVVISVDRLVEETDPNNCLLMIAVSNGLEETVSAGLFTFELSGGGEQTGASMFPQTTAPGETKLAQVILPGRSCDVAETISGGQPQCRINPGTETPESCLDALEFRDAEVAFDIDE